MLYLSARDHARKIKIQQLCLSAIYKQNISISLHSSDSEKCREVIIFEHGCYISALEHVRMLILSSYILLACINAIYKYGHAWVS